MASTQGTGVSALAIETPLAYDLGWVFCGPLTRMTGNKTRRIHQGLLPHSEELFETDEPHSQCSVA